MKAAVPAEGHHQQEMETSKGLLSAPKQTYVNLISKHRRAGSTGTTGDESYTTDEEDVADQDETDCIKSPKDMFDFREAEDSIRRNSSDNSVYSNLTDDCAVLEGSLSQYNLPFSKPDIVRNDSASIDLEVLNVSDESNEESGSSWGRAVVEAKEQAFARLQNELKDAHQELKLRDEEVSRLSRIRQDVEAELEDLTASLFQEAHNMVREANTKQAAAEKALKESQMKVEVLTAEVAALKTLVLTSTPSMPNPHLHPQINSKDDSGLALFVKKHRRSPSHFNLKYGRENSPPESPVKEHAQQPRSVGAEVIEPKDGLEVDPNIHREFLAWKENPTLDKSDPFIKRVYVEDINLCLSFNNIELSEKVCQAVESGTIFVEAVGDKGKNVFPKKCALLEVPRHCHYRMKIGEEDSWYCISQICRNRIIAVCDFLNYLKYIERGLVKSSVHDIYWEIARLRKEMVLARLGLALST